MSPYLYVDDRHLIVLLLVSACEMSLLMVHGLTINKMHNHPEFPDGPAHAMPSSFTLFLSCVISWAESSNSHLTQMLNINSKVCFTCLPPYPRHPTPVR